MGNRGVLHDAHGNIRRSWQLKRWILCVLEFKGRHRQVMSPGHYTELFFLDEATALAAGHRPCAECQRPRYNAYRSAWAAAGRKKGSALSRADAMDEVLHAQRLGPDGSRRTMRAPISELPAGVFVIRAGREEKACLYWMGKLFVWTPGGYFPGRPANLDEEVEVLTPRSTVAVLRAGYVPQVHASGQIK
jgi:hypothetical protein